MIYNLSETYKSEMTIGNKARFLMEMKAAGFRVPGGCALDKDEYFNFLKANNLEKFVKDKIAELNKDNIREISEELRTKVLSASLPDESLQKIKEIIDPNKKYAVRSSGAKEDLAEFSFAGQYESFLNCDGDREIAEGVVKCYASAFGVTVLSYLSNHTIDLSDFYMGVVVEEMVNSEISGVCFTVNPVTGKDKEMLIETVEGLGENLVSGRVEPEEYLYNWYDDTLEIPASNKMLTEDKCREIGKEFLEIMKKFGYPCDIEFAIENGKLYILQSRKITKINYSGIEDVWTTADFKDGGVSATVCLPYMWSLYEYIWNYTIKKFTMDSKIIFEKDFHGQLLGDMFYGRPYWNLSYVKLAMSRVIGYKEREFDSEYGIKINYEGDGNTTGLTPKSAIAIARMALAQKKILKERNENAENLKAELLDLYGKRKDAYDNKTIKDIKKEWLELTRENYLFSESTYFWQIFINTIHQSLYKDGLLKYVSESDYLTMLSCIEDISHLLPFYEIWDISREIRHDEESLNHWKNTDSKKLASEIGEDKYKMESVRHLVSEFGYHSDKELDVAYPCYFEDPEPYIIHIKNSILLDDSFSPKNDKETGRQNYEAIFDKIKNQTSAGKYKKIRTKVDKMRKMLWWREEFRDLSTRFYYLIRVYTIELSKKLVEEKVIEREDDIWFIKVAMLWDYLEGRTDVETLRKMVIKNREYYNAFRNYISENEIGSVFDGKGTSEETLNNGRNKLALKGIGANNGIVTGTARVIKDFSEIDRLSADEILVTRFTDTGWTPIFAILKGIVTEYGGILCHAAIVSREYGIPAVVACHDVMDTIEDGQTITINGTTGEVIIND